MKALHVLLVVGLLVCSAAWADLGGFLKKAAKVAINPVGAAHEEAAKKIAPAVGVNPEVAGKVANPGGQIINHAPAAAAHQVKGQLEHLRRLKEAAEKGDIKAVVVNEATAPLEQALNPAIVEAAMPVVVLSMTVLGKDNMMDPPSLQEVNAGKYGGEPVVYINGMLTDKEAALSEATWLSKQLKRPVQLLYNGSSGPVGDLGDSILSRFSPLFVLPGKPEFDGTSKQIAHLVYHSPRPLSIVSHSQGCILTRNGLMIAESFRPIRHNVAWVATGVPMRNEEIYPQPVKFTRLVNNSDLLVGQVASLNFDPKMFEQSDKKDSHSFSLAYVDQVKNEMLFGEGYEPDKDRIALEARWGGVYSFGDKKCSLTFGNETQAINEQGNKAILQFVSRDTVKVTGGTGWDAGLTATLEGDNLRWSNGSLWNRVKK